MTVQDYPDDIMTPKEVDVHLTGGFAATTAGDFVDLQKQINRCFWMLDRNWFWSLCKCGDSRSTMFIREMTLTVQTATRW
jgi:hypothetical protein